MNLFTVLLTSDGKVHLSYAMEKIPVCNEHFGLHSVANGGHGPGCLEQVAYPLEGVTLLSEHAPVLDVGDSKMLCSFCCSHLVATLLDLALVSHLVDFDVVWYHLHKN